MPTLEYEDGPPTWEFLHRAQVIGRSELPHFLRLKSPRTASAWQQRGALPPADYEAVNGLMAWRRLTVVKWAARTNRLPPWLEPEARRSGFLPAQGRKRPASNGSMAHV